MNFLNIFAFVAIILAIFSAQIEAKKGKGDNGHVWKAGSHVAGKAVEGVGAEIVRQIG